MPRRTSAPTDAAPFLQTWDAADQDVTSVDANQAPIFMPGLAGQDFLVVLVSTDAAAGATRPTLQLTLVSHQYHADAAANPIDPTVVGVQEVRVGPALRQAHADNGGGEQLYAPIQFDLRGWNLSQSTEKEYFLGVSDMDNATAVNVMEYGTFKGRPS